MGKTAARQQLNQYYARESVRENHVSFASVDLMAENQPRRGGIAVSPGRKPWVKWEIDLSPFRDGRVLTHSRESL